MATHIISKSVSALPRIYCSVANPPSSSYPHQANPAPSQHACLQGIANQQAAPASTQQQQQQQLHWGCKLEHSTSSGLPHEPVTVKPELQELARQGSQTQHTVVTSGHIPVLSATAAKSTCQPQPLPESSCHHQQQLGSIMQQQHPQQHPPQQQQDQVGMAYSAGQLDYPCSFGACKAQPHTLEHRQDTSAYCQDWRIPRSEMDTYNFGDSGTGLGSAANDLHVPCTSGKGFSEQELMAWHLIPPEQAQADVLTAQHDGLNRPMSHNERECPDIGEACLMIRCSSNSTPGIQDWEEAQVWMTACFCRTSPFIDASCLCICSMGIMLTSTDSGVAGVLHSCCSMSDSACFPLVCRLPLVCVYMSPCCEV